MERAEAVKDGLHWQATETDRFKKRVVEWILHHTRNLKGKKSLCFSFPNMNSIAMCTFILYFQLFLIFWPSLDPVIFYNNSINFLQTCAEFLFPRYRVQRSRDKRIDLVLIHWKNLTVWTCVSLLHRASAYNKREKNKNKWQLRLNAQLCQSGYCGKWAGDLDSPPLSLNSVFNYCSRISILFVPQCVCVCARAPFVNRWSGHSGFY